MKKNDPERAAPRARREISSVSSKRHPLAIIVFALFAIVVISGALRVLLPYAAPIIFAAIIVVATYGLYEKLLPKMGNRRGLAAAVMLLGVTLIIVIPALVLTILLVQQASDLVDTLQKTDPKAMMNSLRLTERLAVLQKVIPGFNPATLQPEAMLLNVARRLPGIVAGFGKQFLAGFAGILIGFALMLLAAFYFYTDGRKLARQIKYLSPLPDEYDEEIAEKFTDVVNATFRGQFLTALAQGTVTGIGLAICGVQGAIFWGAVAALLGVLPMVGPAAIWVPASIYLLAAASFGGEPYWKAIFMIAWGVLVVSLVDNIVRPWAMRGGNAELPAVVLLFSIFGGITVFGFVGLILGPLLFALLATVVHIYRNFFREALETQNVADDVIVTG